MKKNVLALMLVISMVIPIIGSTGIFSYAIERADAEIISVPKKDLMLWYDEESPYGNEDLSIAYKGANEYKDIPDDGWEKWSLPLGNGYSGINVFGRTDTERIQITDNTLSSQLNKIETVNGTDYFAGGLNNFSETYLDFGHAHESVTNYTRALDLRTAISTVNYTYDGVNYSREYFTSYPDKAIVIYLEASGESNLNFTLRPTIPYEQDYMVKEGDGFSKHGTVVANNDGTITLSGNLGYNDVDFAAKYKIINSGGTVIAKNGTNENAQADNGTLTVSGANSAYIVITLSTNYELSSDIFTTSSAKDKLNNSTIDAMATAETELAEALAYTYSELRERHIADYDNLFGRVEIDFGAQMPSVTTDVLLNNYINGNHDPYLEEIYFQFGRYLLIASSREGSLPANLQGTWNRYNLASWGSGYWHNINVQMNYWPAFSTNLSETFTSYIDFFDAFLPQAQNYATGIISGDKYKDNLGKDGGNGWTIGVGSQAQHISTSSGAGNVGFTTQMFWDYYDYTRDMEALSDIVYPALKEASLYITKTFAKEPDGTYLSIWGDSPEQWVDGVWYYTKGTTYDQSFAYNNGYYTLLAAELLGIEATDEGESILATIAEQLPYYNPIVVGYSGQVKEFREEDYYGDLGEYAHRHISQLVGLYPGNLINSTTPAWIDAAKYTLSQREMGTAGDTWGWSIAHRQNLWARVGDGDEAYHQYQKLLTMRTATNLWSKTPAGFQIDGNFGGTAGVSEMLLQSQSGYIEPLAAIPAAWATGSYSGLVARGNFEVSAKWEDGNAKVFNIKSNAGGLCQVKHDGLANAVVLTADGKTVSHTQVSNNIISFETTVGETYIICNISPVEEVTAPTNLTVNAIDKNSYFLNWNASSDAVRYNVYKAIENDSDYTFVGTTDATSCVYNTSADEENKRMTYRICAVNANGAESDGTLAYVNPIETDIISVNVCEADGKLQFAIDTEGTYADLFRVYEKLDDGTYKLVAESKFSVISLNEYDVNKQYAISTVCGYFESSKIMVLQKTQNVFGQYSENLLLRKPVTYEGLQIWGPSYHPDKVTDGITYANRASIHDGRFASTYSDNVTPSIFTIDLNGVYELEKFTIDNYDSKYRYTDVTIEVLYNGVWTTAATRTLSAGIQSDTYNLNRIKGEKIRITILDAKNSDSITVHEFMCSGTLIGESYESSSNVFVDKHVTVESLYPYTVSDHQADKITDGITMTKRSTASADKYGRFALSAKANNSAILVVELNGLYKLDTLTFDLVNTTCLSYVKIELFNDGKWTVAKESGKGITDTYISNAVFNLNDSLAEKVRITVQNNVSTNGVAIQEILCSGQRVKDSGSYHNVLKTSDTYDYEGTSIDKSFPPERITNDLKIYGVSNGWYTWKDAVFSTVKTTNPSITLTYNLDAVYALETLNIEGYANGYVDTVKVEAYYNGAWTTVFNKTYSNTKYFYEGLGDALASKVRITLSNTSQQTINIYEMSISGHRVSDFDRISATDAIDTLIEKATLLGDSGYINLANTLLAQLNRVIADASYDDTKVNAALSKIESFTELGVGDILPSDLIFSYTFDENDSVPSSTTSTFEAVDDISDANYKPNSSDLTNIQIRNQQNSYSIVNDNGNYVFKRGNGTAKNTGYVNFFADCDGFQPSHVANYANAGRNFVFEFDIKAVNVPNEITLLQFITRAASSTIFAPILKLKTDGSIYASKDSNKATIVNVKGNEYINIAVFVDVSANKYYVYVDGVNANTDGFEFLSENQWNSIAGTYTAGKETVTLDAGEFIFGEARVLQDGNTTAEVYMDNFTAYYAYEKLIPDVDFTPKTSITLGSELVYNVYVPAVDYLESFTVDGKTYENPTTVTLNDGNQYYRVAIPLAASQAAREIKLVATINDGTLITTGSFTFSVTKYATKVLNNSDASSVEIQLIKDVLSYVRAAYAYFIPEDTKTVSDIDAIIGKNYDATSQYTPAGSTDTPSCFKGSTFALTSTPAIKFYLNDGVDENGYSFKIGNRNNIAYTTGTDTTGKYLRLNVYAYALCETVECFYKGEKVGSYHIASYLAWANTQNDSKLVTLVERFWKYSESSRDYKNSSTVNINYLDQDGNSLAESKSVRIKPYEEVTVLSPNISGYYTRDIYLTVSYNSDKTINVTYRPLPKNIDTDYVNQILANVICWGDSITAGAGKNEIAAANQYGIDLAALGSAAEGASYVTVVRNLIRSRIYSGISVRGCGVGGESTATIAARADTETYYLYLDDAVTISSSAVIVPLTHYSSGGRVGILRQGGSDEINPVTIVGKDSNGNDISVTGSLTLSLTSDAPSGTDIRTCDAKYLKYTFTRDDGKNDTLNFVSGARVITKASYIYDGRTCIIFMGENGGYRDTDELIKQQEEILKACGNPEYYLIISTTSGSYESRTEVRNALSARWGEHYINMGDMINSRSAYEFAGYSESVISTVADNIASGTVSQLLIKDTCHPNAVGYAIIGNLIFERLLKLGAFDKVFDYYDRLSAVTTETFEFNGYTATVVRPSNPNGKWIWKTEFFTAFDKAERTLLDEGYTRVYYQISNKYGNPESVSLMESFYHEVTQRYDLDDKCILFGFSRGGLYAFNFALACPEYVDKIYLDAPVLDLKTWPTKSKNPGEFSGMLASYGLTEAEFASFEGSPVDKLEEFFALNIPLLVVAGDADATVPFEDNAGKLIEYALANGHNITYVVEEGKDHHPHSLTDVTLIVDFCNRGSYENVVSNPLTKEDFSGKTITFLGDSITYGVGASSTANRYSSQLASSLGMTEINMGISGTVMCTGGHRTSRLDDIQKISLGSDYVGILLGINDFDQCRNNGTSKYYSLGEFGTSDTTTIYGALDQMCKDLVARFGSTDTKVFLMTPVITSWNNSVSGTRDWDQSKENSCGYTLRELCDAIVEVATYYGIVTLDLNAECEMSAADFSDGIHPNDSGAKKIADTIEKFLLANYSFE